MVKKSTESIVKEIKRQTPKKFSAKEKSELYWRS